MGVAVIFGCNLLEDTIRIDGVVEALVEEARVLEACCEGCPRMSVEVRLQGSSF